MIEDILDENGMVESSRQLRILGWMAAAPKDDLHILP